MYVDPTPLNETRPLSVLGLHELRGFSAAWRLTLAELTTFCVAK